MQQRSTGPARLLALSLLLITAGVHAAAVSGPVVALPNGYYVQPDKASSGNAAQPGQAPQTRLVKRNGTRVLADTVAAYAVSGNIVAGALGPAPAWSPLYTNDRPFEGKPDTRYFILDTTTGKLESDLDDAAWHKRLQELGVPSDFRIYPPPPWQQ